MTMTVPLSSGLVAVVDDEDHAAVMAYAPWSAYRSGRNVYGRRTVPLGGGRGTSVYIHQVVLPGVRVDHINGDGLDNRRSNLRPTTHADNMRNRRILGANNTSGYKGVSRDSRVAAKPWCASITVDRRHVYLGLFADPADAARAYDAAALHHFGEFARLNFPQEQS